MVIGKETIMTQGYKLPLNAFHFVGMSRRECHTVQAYSGLGLTRVSSNIINCQGQKRNRL